MAGLMLSTGAGGASAQTIEQPAPAHAFKGHVHALGMNPSLFQNAKIDQGPDGSVLSSLDLADGSLRQTLLDMAGGHITYGLANGSILCVAHHKPKSMVVTKEHDVVAELKTGPDHVFGGHGLVLEDRNLILLPQRRVIARSASDVGSILVYDATTLRLLDEVQSGGVHPHELHPIPNTDEFAVTHYGDIHEPHPVFEHNVVDAKLTILDSRTLKAKRHYPQGEFNAMVTHMRVDKAGWAYLVLTQFIAWPQGAKNPYATALSELEKAIGRRREFAVPPAALEDQLIPLPLPLLAVHTQTGERKIVDTGDRNHLRSQSVAYCPEADAMVAVYSQSDNLIVVDRSGAARVVGAGRLGLRDMRGVVGIPGTTSVAIMGSYRDVAIYDIATDVVVARYEARNYQDTHLSFDAA
jgi:hypothetical protein